MCQSYILSSITKVDVIDNGIDKTYLQYVQSDEVYVHRASCDRATQPYSIGGEVDLSMRSPRIITECY